MDGWAELATLSSCLPIGNALEKSARELARASRGAERLDLAHATGPCVCLGCRQSKLVLTRPPANAGNKASWRHSVHTSLVQGDQRYLGQGSFDIDIAIP